MNNNSKQILLSVIGVAILVVAVVGVSFAMFSYTRTSTQVQQITTGALSFVFTDGDKITLTDALPISDTEGAALTGNGKVCTFTVTSTTPSTTSIGYTVTLVDGGNDGLTDKTRFADSEISGLLTVTGGQSGDTNALATATALTGLTSSGKLIYTGTIPASQTSKTVTFTLKMWVNNTVTVGETGTYSTSAYGNLYYTAKVKVEATA